MNNTLGENQDSTRQRVDILCRGCRNQNKRKRNHSFKGYIITKNKKGIIENTVTCKGLTYHLTRHNNQLCKAQYNSENLFDKQTNRFDYSTSIIETSTGTSNVRHIPSQLGLSLTNNAPNTTRSITHPELTLNQQVVHQVLQPSINRRVIENNIYTTTTEPTREDKSTENAMIQDSNTFSFDEEDAFTMGSFDDGNTTSTNNYDGT